MEKLPLFILYGSATGNAESIAKDLASKHASNPPSPFSSVICCEANAFKKKCLPVWETQPQQPKSEAEGEGEAEAQIKYGVIMVMSTTGNGDAPENASRFVRYIKKKTTIDSQPMKHTCYAVLALGDSNYDKFCAAGELVDKKMSECGAFRVRKLAKADEATGLEDVVEAFVDSVVKQIALACYKGDEGEKVDNSDQTGEDEEKQQETMQKEQEIQVATISPPPPSSSLTTTIDPLQEQQQEQQTPHDSQDTTSNNHCHYDDIFSLSGPTIIKKLINQPSIPKVDPQTLPSPITIPFATYQPIDNDNHSSNNTSDTNNNSSTNASDQETRIRSNSDMMEHMTISSVSSSNIHYTLNHPYESTILHARYLTNTKLDAAKLAHDTLSSTTNNTNISTNTSTQYTDEKLQQAMNHFVNAFPLNKSTFNTNTDTDDDDDQYLRNGKRVIEMTLSLPDDFTLEYQPGDSIGLLASNSPQASTFILSLLQQNQQQFIKDPKSQLISIQGQNPMTIENAIKSYIDLSSPIKSKKLLVSLAQNHQNNNNRDDCNEDQKALYFLASNDPLSQEIFQLLVDNQRLTIVDLLKLFPSCQRNITLDGLLAILPRIPPRYYSICSSPLHTNNSNYKSNEDGGKDSVVGEYCYSLKVAFSVVDYETPRMKFGVQEVNTRRRVGGLVTSYLETICSSYLIANNNNNATVMTPSITLPSVKIFPKPTIDFRLPSTTSTPMILVGPGTGVAPFIGFLDHRHAEMKAKDAKVRDTDASMSEGTWRGGFAIQEEEMNTNNTTMNTNSSTSAILSSLNMINDSNNSVKKWGDIDLYFGCRHSDHDWLYEDKMKSFESEKIISKLNVAFSREKRSSNQKNDSREKRYYVQDKIRENSQRVAELIVKHDAKVYICGDGNSMAKDVLGAIQESLDEYYSQVGQKAEGSVVSAVVESKKEPISVESMKAENRLLLDIWS